MESTDTGRNPAPGPEVPAATPRSTPRLRGGPQVVLVDEPFTLNELQALRLRGMLREMLPGAYIAAVHPENPVTRARVAAAVAGEQLLPGRALCKGTAAWVFGCAPMPRELDIVVPRYHRPCAPTARMLLRLSEGVLDEEQICSVGGVAVTSPLRTAMDIAFNSEWRESLPVLAAIDASPRLRCGYRQMLDSITEQARRPGRRRALGAVNRLMESGLSAAA